jgi:chemotaxis signal transduction protein
MISILRFSTTQGDFALTIEHVLRIVPATELTPLPDAAEGVRGVVREADALVPVTDALGAGGSMIVVVDVGGEMVGVLAGDVTGVIEIDEAQMGPAPTGQRGGLISAMVTIGRATAMLLDPEALLDRTIARRTVVSWSPRTPASCARSCARS